MAPQSLYRKYRPQRFSEIVGQDHVTTALRNVVREGKVGHAYLFSGPRGTGKTTTARLLAKASNCLALTDDGEPCGKCENCQSIAAGTFYDLIELDAASRRGVESARELVQSVNVGLGATSKTKVYVIDEVHMLTTDASNTLLKTLEEPPEHVVFVLATTEPGKVLPTIRSRTQHFEFTLLSHDQLVGHLADVLAREGVEPNPDALELIARRAAGSARDALSALDQALALGGGKLDRDQVEASFGETAFSQRVAILDGIAADDPAAALVAVELSLTAGTDPRRIAEDLLRTLRDAFVLANAGTRVPYDGPAEEVERLRALATTIGNAALVRAIETLGQAIVDIRGPATPDPRLVLEVAVVRLARRDSRASLDALSDRIERLERAIANGPPAPSTPPSPSAPPASASPTPSAAPAPPAPAASPVASVPNASNGAHLSAAPPSKSAAQVAPVVVDEPESEPDTAGTSVDYNIDDVIAAWPLTLESLKAPLRATIQDAQPIDLVDGTIHFGVPRRRFDAINQRFRAEASTIKDAFAQKLGAVPKFVLKPHDFDAPDALRPLHTNEPAPPPADDVEEAIDLDDLVNAAPDEPVDSASRLMAAFGAEVIEEQPRD
ncbi:MAG: polymerase subunit gamma/tau [Actinomycetia bacterium]|nr:polymerase subunit gamma/tau [Actinomycetes bacterium]